MRYIEFSGKSSNFGVVSQVVGIYSSFDTYLDSM